MSGIYLHIPFCSRKCNYCDFYSIVPLARKPEFVKALIKEISLRAAYLDNDIVETVYFGGGTPSLLSVSELSDIIEVLKTTFRFSEHLEITLEANPEDLSSSYLKGLKSLGINRLSIGVQSFRDSDLVFLKRSHSALDAINSVQRASDIGFENISIDLIYGLPNLSLNAWKLNLDHAFRLPIKHLSSYHLTYEKKTLLYKQLSQKKFKKLTEDSSIEQFEFLMDYTYQKKLPYYEISNFSAEGYHSKHNLSYWQQKKYLGLGPSAHSYDGKTREWNVSNLLKYLEGIDENNRCFEKEVLSQLDIENEFLITNLRTKWGINLLNYSEKFGELNKQKILKSIGGFVEQGLIINKDNSIKFSRKGILLSDFILEKLFRV